MAVVAVKVVTKAFVPSKLVAVAVVKIALPAPICAVPNVVVPEIAALPVTFSVFPADPAVAVKAKRLPVVIVEELSVKAVPVVRPVQAHVCALLVLSMLLAPVPEVIEDNETLLLAVVVAAIMMLPFPFVILMLLPGVMAAAVYPLVPPIKS